MTDLLKPLNLKAKVSSIRKETHDSNTVEFNLSEDLNFKPGQFFMLQLELEDRDDFKVLNDKPRIQRRSYSIASSPTEKCILNFLIKKEPDGFVSKYLVDNLREGDEVTLLGPYGHFTFSNDDAENVVLLGAGSGIAPLRCISKYVIDKGLPTNTVFFYSNKTEQDIIRREELEKWNAEHDNITVVNTLTREPEDSSWSGERKHIDLDLIKKYYDKDLNDALYYICGPPKFVQGMRDMLTEAGVEKEKVKVEIYG